MVINEQEFVNKVNINIDGKDLEKVDEFTYLGTRITADGEIEKEINIRIAKDHNENENETIQVKCDINSNLWK